MYIAYNDFEKVAEGKSLEEVASLLGTKKQYISRKKVSEGFYQYKTYIVLNPRLLEARAQFAFARLAWLLNNPATAYIAGVEIIKTVEKIKANILD